jgi:phosphate-selective porin
LSFFLFIVGAVHTVIGGQQPQNCSGTSLFGRLHVNFPVGSAIYDDRPGELNITDINLGARANISDVISLFTRLTAKRYAGVLSVSDLLLNIRANDRLVFSLGQMKTRFSMDDSTTADYSLLDDHRVFVDQWEKFLSSAVGVTGRYATKNFGLSIGYFGNSIRDVPEMADKTMISQRYYGNPYKNTNSIVHIGISHIKFRDRISSNSLDRFGFEFALNYSFFNLQIEKKYRNFLESNLFSFVFSNFFSSSAKENMEKNRMETKYNESFYAQININFTGENLKYKDGSFGFVDIRRPLGKGSGYGTFGLAFRFVKYDMWLPRQEYREYTVGLNWIPTNNMRLSLQYSYLNQEFNIAAKAGTGSRKGSLISLKWKLFF